MREAVIGLLAALIMILFVEYLKLPEWLGATAMFAVFAGLFWYF